MVATAGFVRSGERTWIKVPRIIVGFLFVLNVEEKI
jgi:hypothetical protein